MKLSTGEESSLVLTIADLLRDARTSPIGTVRFPNTRNVHQQVRARIGSDLDDRISDVCGEFGLIDFLRFTITREILRDDIEPARGPLTKTKSYNDTLDAAKRLTQKVAELPQKFRISSPLPVSFSYILLHGIDTLELGNGVRIVSAEWLSERINLECGSEGLAVSIIKNVDLKLVPKAGSHFICTWHSGFAGHFVGNPSTQEHLDKVRALHGCLFALDIVEEDAFFNSLEQHAVLANDATSGESGELLLTERVDSDLSYFYENFDVSLDYYKSPPELDAEDSDIAEAPNPVAPLDPEEASLQTKALEALKRPFGKGDYNRRLFTSCLWLFRSHVSTRPLDVILEATIALEVLLGDRDVAEGIGLTKLLANRCAYLLGRSAEERNKIMSDFKSIYDIRSQIVHTGLHQMDRRANEASLSARSLASKILRHELEL